MKAWQKHWIKVCNETDPLTATQSVIARYTVDKEALLVWLSALANKALKDENNTEAE